MKCKAFKIMSSIIIFILIFSEVKVNGINTMLKVAFEPNLPPYQFEDNGEYVGFHIDLLNNIAERNKFIIEYMPMESESDCLDALGNGEVDIVLGVKNNNLKFKDQMTESISQSSIVMIASNENVGRIKNDISMSSITAVIENESIGYSYMRKMGSLRSVIVSNQTRAFEMLTTKKVDALVGVRNSILYQMEKSHLEDSYTIISNYMVPIEYTMLVKNGDKDLLKKLNDSLQQIRISGNYEKLYDKWINEDKNEVKEIIKKIIVIATIASTVVVSIIIIYLRLNINLKKQVNEKTKELQITNNNLINQIIETRNSNELRNNIVEHSPTGIIVFDKEFKITLFNESACKLTGTLNIPIGENIFSIAILTKILMDKMDKLFIEDATFINQEITIKTKNKENISYRYNIYQLHNNDDSIRGAILTVDDITEELRMKEQIFEKEKNKELNRMIAGIAHEIRNPLASIKTFVELIPTKMNNQKFQDQFAEIVPKEVDRVNNLIRNLIDYAKPETTNKEMILINDIVKSCTTLINPMLKKEGIELVVDEEECLEILADKNQLKQIIINILLNGYDSIKDKIESNSNATRKFRIVVKVWKNDEYNFIQVIDEGTGMSDEQIKRCTEPFFTTKANGTGLGLALSKQFVEENNGVMILESELSAFTRITLKFRRQEWIKAY